MTVFCPTRRAMLGAGVALAAGAAPSWAQPAYPSRPVKFVVPFAPGADTDILAREIGTKLNQAFGYTVVVENKPGKGGSVGTEAALREAADGYTGAVISGSYISGVAFGMPNHDAVGTIQPVIQFSRTPSAMVVGGVSNIKTLEDFIRQAKARPGKVTYGTSGVGGLGNLSGEYFAMLAGIKLSHVPYKGASSVLGDVISGQVDMTLAGIAALRPLIKAGKLRLLAVGDTKRLPDFPDAPTYAEAGMPAFDFELWHGLIMPKGVPAAVVEKLNADINAVLKSPELRQHFAQQAVVPIGGAPEQFAQVMRRDLERYRQVIKAGNIKAE